MVIETGRPALASTAVRLFVGPANFAGQGYLWAKAAGRLPDVSAVAGCFANDSSTFVADQRVRMDRWARDRRWQREQLEYLESCTHVLLEAARPILGNLHGFDPLADLAALERSGVSTAMIAHGTDARLPSRHSARYPFSPFADSRWEEVPILEASAARSLARYQRFSGPVFVSTPDLLDDLPEALWCPVVVEKERWITSRRVLSSPVPVVVHAPSNTRLKGSEIVDSAARGLHDQGLLCYRPVRQVPADDMPEVVADADVVIDQLRIGSYGVTACEAMAAGRLVVGHVADHVRERVRQRCGLELPIVEATPDSLAQVLEQIALQPQAFVEIADRGPEFVTTLHDGTASAEVLSTWLVQNG